MEKKYFLGFTLVELMIVIAIIGILAALIVAAFTGQIFKGNDAKRKEDISRIQVAAEEYRNDHPCYPTNMGFCGSKSSQSDIYPYLNNIPCDPIYNTPYVYVAGPSNATCPSWYKIYSILQNTQDASIIPYIGPHSAYNYVRGSSNAPGDVAGTAQTTSPTSSTSPTSTPGTGQNFYGCLNGSCQTIGWDNSISGPACDPNYQNPTCYGQCGVAGNQCVAVH